jgi:hypothetical protein
MTHRRSGTTVVRGAIAPISQPTTMRAGIRRLAPTVRSTAMLLLNEELARARMRDAEAVAARVRLGARVQAAHKWQRRAERAARRAHLAAAEIL